MSQENVELVRRWGEALSRGELPLELSHTELRLDNIAEFPNRGPYHGHEGLRRWWEDVAEAFDELRFEIERLIDVDDQPFGAAHGRPLQTHGYSGRQPLGFALLD
jgi:hypothetical protein